MIEVKVTESVLDVADLENRAGSHSNGAVCSFIGQVRNRARGRDVAYLEYQAYVPMAEKMLFRIAEEASTRWGCDVLLHHRIGRIDLGEASVAVVIGSPHRAAAFEACRYCIDTLKEEVPIWKREVCPDGTFWIEGDEALSTGTP